MSCRFIMWLHLFESLEILSSFGISNGCCGGLIVDPEESAWISRMTEPCFSSEIQTAERERATVIGHVNEQFISQFGVASFTNNFDNHYDMVLEGIQAASTLSFHPPDESATVFAVMNEISTSTSLCTKISTSSSCSNSCKRTTTCL